MSNGFYSGELGPSTIVAWREALTRVAAPNFLSERVRESLESRICR